MPPQNNSPLSPAQPETLQQPAAPPSVTPSTLPDSPLFSGGSPTPPTKSNKKLILATIASLLVVGAGAAGYFVFKSDKKPTPSANTVTTNKDDKNKTNPEAENITKTCLATPDYNSLLGYDNDIEFTSENMHTDNVHFMADSAEYEDSSETGTIDNYATWVKEISKKKFVHLILEGGTNDVNTDASSLSLAQARANKVKTDLVAAGVPENLISTRVMEKQSDTQVSGIDRVVVLYVDPTCS
jgi:outer membrane protein OmpA-like peptidoglycan-associated protein